MEHRALLLITENQAVGLVNRNIHQLKKQGVLQSSGGHYNKKYTFSEVLFQLKQESYHLPSKQTALKNELLITQYELQAYDDLLNQCQTEKKKIIKLHKKTSDKLYQLHGQLRAINQLLTY